MDLIAELGGPSAVARMLKIKPPSVLEWRKRGIPTDRCPVIERETGGRFPCERLRDDVVWVRMADSAWPWHPNGRPLLDQTGACLDVGRGDHPAPGTEAAHAG